MGMVDQERWWSVGIESLAKEQVQVPEGLGLIGMGQNSGFVWMVWCEHFLCLTITVAQQHKPNERKEGSTLQNGLRWGQKKGPQRLLTGSGFVIQTPWRKPLQLRIRKGLTDFFTHLWIKISS